MPAQYHIHLSVDKQRQPKDIIHQAKVAKHKRIHAQLLLCLDENDPKFTEIHASQTGCVVSIKTVQSPPKPRAAQHLRVTLSLAAASVTHKACVQHPASLRSGKGVRLD